MTLQINKTKRNLWSNRRGAILMTVMFLALAVSNLSLALTVKQRTFTSPEEAVEAVTDALISEDQKALEAILGPGSRDIITFGDPVADRAARERFLIRFFRPHDLYCESRWSSLLEGYRSEHRESSSGYETLQS